jgi:hypothetical protein
MSCSTISFFSPNRFPYKINVSKILKIRHSISWFSTGDCNEKLVLPFLVVGVSSNFFLFSFF